MTLPNTEESAGWQPLGLARDPAHGVETSGMAWLAEPSGLYVHVPFCRSKCRYCGFPSVPVAGRETGRLVAALLRELDRYAGAEFATAYIGGGSPTALPAGQLLALVGRITARFPGVREFTVECNPGQVDAGLLAALRQAGANRLSFGAQSFRPAELELLGRAHTVEQIGQAVESARRAGFDNLGLDMIFAIPGSTLADWQCSVEAALDLDVQHISAYSLSFEPGTVFEAWRATGRLEPVDEELDRAMYEWALERLEQAGLAQYEISNFARPRYECRHNLGYWGNRPFVGIGPGAASSRTGFGPQACSAFALGGGLAVSTAGGGCGTGDSVVPVEAGSRWLCDRGPKRDESPSRTRSWAGRPSCGQGVRVTNDPDIECYVAAVENDGRIPGEVQPVGREDGICETAVLGLRMRVGIDRAAFWRRTGHDVMRVFAGPIRRYRDLGLIEVTDRAVRLTAWALPVADSILCDFAALE
jgi:oxygen-independent coproporphyrinogen-3 oxidase